jgi:hypothetical protein
MKKMSLKFVSVLSTGLGLFLLSTIQVSAQPLVKDTPTAPPPNQEIAKRKHSIKTVNG